MRRAVRCSAMFLFVFGIGTAVGATHYVDAASTGAVAPYTSWGTAASNVQNAINAASSNDVVWVAAGTYTPGVNQTDSFVLTNGVNVYGGFVNGMANLADRNWVAHPTILSGEIGLSTTMTDNCFHVVLGANNATLDGFTVTAGYAGATNYMGILTNYEAGGGFYATNCSPIVANCTFCNNYATNYGGGLCIRCFPSLTNSPVVSNCTFVGNNVNSGGGALAMIGFLTTSKINATLVGCQFITNSSKSSAGAMYLATMVAGGGDSMTTTVDTCTFVGNKAAGGSGGGVAYVSSRYPLFKACMFANNSSAGYPGGALALTTDYPTFTNCTFSGNSGTSGGAVYMLQNVLAAFDSCTFAGNSGSTSGGAINNSEANWKSGNVTMRNCTFAGNNATANGGAISQGPTTNNTRLWVANCTFVGNKSTGRGGAISFFSGLSTLTNVTMTITNSILWGDSATTAGNELYSSNVVSVTMGYNDVTNGGTGAGVVNDVGVNFTDAGGNISTDPLFADVRTGKWTAAASYNASVGQTTLTDGNAAWAPGELTGMLLNPRTNQILQYVIATNTATTILAWGNCTNNVLSGTNYFICDYHLKSKSGRYVSGTATWLQDSVHSPCIDAGDPSSAYALEPTPNGNRINMGADGNTAQASKSWKPQVGTLILFGCDFSGSGSLIVKAQTLPAAPGRTAASAMLSGIAASSKLAGKTKGVLSLTLQQQVAGLSPGGTNFDPGGVSFDFSLGGEYTTTNSMSVEVAPMSFYNKTTGGSFCLSQNDPAVMTFTWKRNSGTNASGRLCVQVPTNYVTAMNSAVVTPVAGYPKTVTDGSEPYKLYKFSINGISSSYANSGRITPYQTYGTYCPALLLTTTNSSGMAPVGVNYWFENGSDASPYTYGSSPAQSVKRNIALTFMPSVSVAAKPNTFLIGMLTGYYDEYLNFSGNENLLAEFVARTCNLIVHNKDSAGDGYGLSSMTAAYRSNGVRRLEALFADMANGFDMSVPGYTMSNSVKFTLWHSTTNVNGGYYTNFDSASTEAGAVCPVVIYNPGVLTNSYANTYYSNHAAPWIRQAVSNYDGAWANWEPWQEDAGCLCSNCLNDLVQYCDSNHLWDAAHTEAGLRAGWPTNALIGAAYDAQRTPFRNWQHGQVVQTIASTIRSVPGADTLGFTPGITPISLSDNSQPLYTCRMYTPTAYMSTMKYLEPWGPYAMWNVQQPLDPLANKGLHLDEYCLAQGMRAFTDTHVPYSGPYSSSHPKLIAMPNGMDLPFDVQEPEGVTMDILSFFVNRFDAAYMYFFPRGYDNRYWAAMAGANRLAAEFEDFVYYGDPFQGFTATPQSPYPHPKGQVNSTVNYPDLVNIPLLQVAGYSLGDSYLVAAGNFWENGDVYFTLTAAGLDASTAYVVREPDNGRYFANASGATFTGAQLVSGGVLLQVGALRWGFFTIEPYSDGVDYGVAVTPNVVQAAQAAAQTRLQAAKIAENGTAPTIVIQPITNIVVKAPSTATFSIAATGSDTLLYQWQKNGTNIAGATSTSYTTPLTVFEDDQARFRCVVSNDAGSVTSGVGYGLLTVHAAPVIVTQPDSATKNTGDTAVFGMTAKGTATLAYQWQYSSNSVAWTNVTTGTGGNSANYTTAALVAGDDNKLFRCTVTNSYGSATTVTTATLRVNSGGSSVPPMIVGKLPATISLNPGQCYTGRVVATGTAPLTYQWMLDGVVVGGNSPTYATPVVSLSDSGKVVFVTVSGYGAPATNSGTLSVRYSTPYFYSVPACATRKQGTTVTFSCIALPAGLPPFTYQWQISTNGGANYSDISGATASTYTPPPVGYVDDGNRYRVWVFNGTTNCVSSTTNGVLTVDPRVNSPTDVAVNLGQQASFSITAGGTGPFTYQWRKNGNPIAGAAGAMCLYTPTNFNDNGALFDCFVVAPTTTLTTATATLSINAIPLIIASPDSLTVAQGETAVFRVIADGSPTLAYQWNKNGAAIAGATEAAYTVTSANAGDAATYTCTVSNSIGSTNSLGATLTVNILYNDPSFASTNYVNAASVNPVSPYTNWQTAATSLQAAINVAASNGAVWVAAGTYTPGVNRTDSFQLVNGVGVYGGFTNGMQYFHLRDGAAHPTILSGDIGIAGVATDNCYHVVIGTDNAPLDGFTVTGGFADGSAPNNVGGGYWASNASPIVANCTWAFNTATNQGGGMYVYNNASEGSVPMTLTACTFLCNTNWSSGAGLYVHCNVVLSNCTFRGNASKTTGNGQGAGMYLDTKSNTVSCCTFISNTSSGGNGGGFGANGGATPCILSGCIFTDNRGGASGSAAFGQSGNYVFTNCMFSGNNGGGYGQGAAIYSLKGNLTLLGCTFAGNTAPGSGYNNGGVLFSPSTQVGDFKFTAQNCMFAGNEGYKSGGALTLNGSGAAGHTATVCLASSTFAGNHAADGGAIVATGPALVLAVTNCLFWGDAATSASAEMSNNNAIVSIGYGDINTNTGVSNANGTSMTDGGGNFSADPLFAMGGARAWSATGTFDVVAGQTTLTDSGTNWTSGSLMGMTINPNTSQWRQFVVVTNSATTVVVWGNAASLGTNNATYQVWDYHLKSQTGRWVVGTRTWVMDAVHSPCIDTGDPAAPYASEPSPNGSRINVGADGNTVQASKSP